MQSRFAVLLLAVVMSSSLFAAINVGDTASNPCWKNEADKSVCIDDFKGNIRVLLYNAGWCPPCNQEFKELVPQVKQFEKKNVAFLSTSGEGWSRGAKPDATFLKEWKSKHKIPFAVLGNFREFGKQFFTSNGIPAVAIIDEDGKLAYAEIAPGADEIVEQVKKLLAP